MPEQPASALRAIEPIEQPELLVDRVAATIRDGIRSGELPPGTHLSVPELARTLRVSRTPARDALFVLAREGLVEAHPRRGAIVLHGKRDDLVELFELREALDGLAARLAARRITPDQIGELRQILSDHVTALRVGDADRYLGLDLAFHVRICEIAGNSRLLTTLTQLRQQIRLVMAAGVGQPGPIGRSVIKEHRAIITALAGGNPDDAEHAARSHVRSVSQIALHPEPPPVA